MIRELTSEEQEEIVGGEKYQCKKCGYTFGYTGYREWLWGSVSKAKDMHEYFKHEGKDQKWITID